jgi:hypothetical protein
LGKEKFCLQQPLKFLPLGNLGKFLPSFSKLILTGLFLECVLKAKLHTKETYALSLTTFPQRIKITLLIREVSNANFVIRGADSFSPQNYN